MSDYLTRTGDTFAIISRKVYGVETESARIARANPGTVEPLLPGTRLVIPVLPSAPLNSPQLAPSVDPDEVAISIGGTRFRFWEGVRIIRAIDTIDMVEFGAPFDPDAPGFRDSFRPFSYQDVDITVGGQPLFTGTMVGVSPSLESDKRTIQVSAYALPGVLNDCTPPPPPEDAESWQFDQQNLRQITKAICAPFGISFEFAASAGAPFEEVACDPGTKAMDFLADLAKKRNLVISNTERGALLFQKSIGKGKPVARLNPVSGGPCVSVIPAFSPQEYYSHITGISPVAVGAEGSQFTVKNPRLTGVVRPLTFKIPDTEDADTKQAVDAKTGRMLANMVSYTVQVTTWRDLAGNLWKPNTTLMLTAPGAMIYSEYEFLIRSVEFRRDAGAVGATLNLVLPEAFSDKIPERMPWD